MNGGQQNKNEDWDNDIGIIDEELVGKFQESIAKGFIVLVVDVNSIFLGHWANRVGHILVSFIYLINV